MKPFPFGHEKYRKYCNTFLQNITIGFDFPKSVVEKEKLNQQFNDYVLGFFGLSKNYDLTNGECNISRKDMTHSFTFTDHSAVIQIGGKNYVGFSESAIPLVFRLRNFFNKVVETKTITKAGVRKLNVFNIKANGQTAVNAEDVRNAIFGKDFLADLNTDNLDGQESVTPNFMKCQYKKENTELTIRTALLPPSTSKDEFHHLILDTLGILTPESGIRTEEVADELMDLNSVLYQSYHWCVNDNVKKLMMRDEIIK